MIRKATVFALFLLLIGSTPVLAQLDVKPGVRAGVNFANLRGDDVPDNVEGTTGLHAGVVLLVDPAGPLAFQPELLYTQKGYELSEGENTFTLTANYIQVNALAKLQIPVTGPISPHVSIGPAVGVKASENAEASGSEVNISGDTDQFKDTEISGVFGAGVDITAGFGTVMIDVRYDLGLTNIIDESDPTPSVKTGHVRHLRRTPVLKYDLKSIPDA
ncbi:MAG: outer membrane beta-barrel protein [Bacteroidetes bacterium]|nr:outer membrane beta-barrel protein [Bacteroidota bacterium]